VTEVGQSGISPFEVSSITIGDDLHLAQRSLKSYVSAS
jgi:hypothetical protein